MLVLTRKLQQQIKIGDQITVTILRVKGNTVRVGVAAPREVRVVRGELPKLGESEETTAAPTEEVVVMEARLTLETRDETPVSEESRGAEEPSGEKDALPAAGAEVQPQPAMNPAAHLPLRRLHMRRGAAPLKQVVASCAALAK